MRAKAMASGAARTSGSSACSEMGDGGKSGVFDLTADF